jgi:predicted Zn-dependent protease
MLEIAAEASASAGKLQLARELYRQATDGAQRAKLPESAAGITARQAGLEAAFGNPNPAREGAHAALALNRNRGALFFAAVAYSMAGDFAEASPLVDELSKRYPTDTFVTNTWVPSIRGLIEINRGSPAKAIELLRAATPYEFGWPTRVLPNYVRGLAYLKTKQGKEGAEEFQKILDHRGVCGTSPLCSLSHLLLARARLLSGDNAGARTAYQDFFALWKDSDSDIPILKEAKSEYAKLQ